MKKLILSTAIFILNMTSVWSQTTLAFDLKLDFQSGKYKLEKASFYNVLSPSKGSSKDGSNLISASFECQSYTDYMAFFMPGECHVTAETFASWKEGLGQYLPILHSHYLLSSGNQHYAITKYVLSYNNMYYIVPSAQKEVNGKWYFLNLQENVVMQPLLRFFAAAQESFFMEILDKQSLHYQNPSLFESGHMLRAEFLAANFFNKYRNEFALHSSLNEVFEDLVIPVERNQGERYPELITYLQKAQLKQVDRDYIFNLLSASMPTEAIHHFLQQTGLTIEQFFQECPNALTP